MIPDVHITDWFIDSTLNPPTDGTYIGSDMPRQLRNIKSIVREEYGDRWQAFPLEPTWVDADTVSFVNDGTTSGFPIPIFPGWAIRFHSESGVLSYGYATNVTVGTPTTVDVEMTQGVIPNPPVRMDIGQIPESRAYYELGRHGTFTISGTASSATVTFASLALPPMPRALYQVLVVATSITGTPPYNALFPQAVTPATTNFVAGLQAAPGAGNSVTFDWAIREPFQSVNF